MAEIVNLRLVRKAKARVAKEATAAANRTAFGRNKAEKTAAKMEAERRERALDGAERERLIASSPSSLASNAGLNDVAANRRVAHEEVTVEAQAIMPSVTKE